MTNVKPKHIPRNPEELYNIITESHDYIDKKDWSRLGQTAKERYTKLFNKLYSVPSLPKAGTVVRIKLADFGVPLTGVVTVEGSDGRVLVYDPNSLSDRRTLYIDEIKSLTVAQDPFRDSEVLW